MMRFTKARANLSCVLRNFKLFLSVVLFRTCTADMTFLHTKIYVRQSFRNRSTQHSISLNKSPSINALGRYEKGRITNCLFQNYDESFQTYNKCG